MPKILEDNFDDWTKLLLDKIDRGIETTSTDRNRYSHKDIKQALIEETSGKCAYCESKIRHISFGEKSYLGMLSLQQ